MKSKIFKKIIGLFLLFSLIASPLEAVNAQITNKLITEKTTGKTFDMIPMTDPTLIVPYLTFPGVSGSCRLDYMSGTNCISWGVRLNVGLASFSGDIYVSGTSSMNTYHGDFAIYGSGGVIELPYLPSGGYTASLVGTAIGLDGNPYRTVSNTSLPFYR